MMLVPISLRGFQNFDHPPYWGFFNLTLIGLWKKALVTHELLFLYNRVFKTLFVKALTLRY